MLTKEQCAAHLKTLGDIGAGEDERKGAMKAMAEYLEGQPDGEEKPEGEKKAEGDDKVKPGEGTEAAEKSEGATEEKKAEGEEGAEGDKVEKKAVVKMATDLTAAQRRIDVLEINALLRDRADLPESVRTWCATQTLATVKGYLKSSPSKVAERDTRTVQGDGAGSPQGLQGVELDELNKAMGVRPPLTKQFDRTPTGELVMHNIGPTKARELAAKAEGARK